MIGSVAREEMFKAYNQLCDGYATIRRLFQQNLPPGTFSNLKAYSLGEIESGLKAEEYMNSHATVKSTLEELGIIDDCGELIEEEEDNA